MNMLKRIGIAVKNILNIDLDSYICVIGGSNLDIYATSSSMRRGDSSVGSISIASGGVARNIAENLGRLYVPTIFVSAVGDDAFGNMLFNSLSKVGVRVNGVRRIANAQTGVYVSILDEIRKTGSAINDMGILSLLNREWIKKCSELVSRADIVVIDCNLKHEALDEIMVHAKGKVFVDTVSMTKSVNIIPYLDKVWAIKPTINEIELLTGIKVNDEEAAINALKAVGARGVHSCALCVEPGVELAYNAGTLYRYTYEPVKAVNSTGGSDAWIGAWAASEFAGEDFDISIKKSIVASMKNEQVINTVDENLSPQSLNDWLKEIEIETEVLEEV